MSELHDAEAIRTFFDQWDLYRRVIAHDYMFHRSIHAALRAFLQNRVEPGFSLVDLGCGDASTISETLRGLPVRRYIGVDLSPVALENAARTMTDAGIPASFVCSDFMDFIRSAPAGGCDVIVAGFTLHHLHAADRVRFFAEARRLLTPTGRLLVYDVFRSEGESREASLRRVHAWRESTWSALSSEELASIWAHVSTADFPTTPSESAAEALEAGFPEAPTELFVSPVETHRLLVF